MTTDSDASKEPAASGAAAATPKSLEVYNIQKDVVDSSMFQLPATYVEAFSTQYWNGLIRLSMGEGNKKRGRHWRFVALMELSDVKRLIRLLQSVIDEMEEADRGDD